MFPVERWRIEVAAWVADLDASALPPPEAAELYERLAALGKLVDAAKTLVATQAAASGEWSRRGHRCPESWMASVSGSTLGSAGDELRTAAQVADLPGTEAALRAGRLSPTQAVEVASAASAAPGAEAMLLRHAEVADARGLRQECARVRAAAVVDEDARYSAVRRRRCLRQWNDPDGSSVLQLRSTPDTVAGIMAAVEQRARQVFDEARRSAQFEPRVAYLHDALVSLVHEPGARAAAGPRASIHVTVDAAALARGAAEPGERCEIAGVGPVPVATARALLTDSLLTVLVTKGREVVTHAHSGRTIHAAVRRALEARDRCCVVPGCSVAHGLQIDHVSGYAKTRWTAIDDLARLCAFHHHLKTYDGFTLHRRGDEWEWRPPP